MYDSLVSSTANMFLKKERLVALGLLSLESAYLDHSIERVIWNLIPITDKRIGHSITRHASTPLRLDIMLTLSYEKFGESPQHNLLKKLANNIRDSTGKRNEFIHSALEFESDEDMRPYLEVIKARGQLKIDSKPFDISDIESVCKEIASISNELFNFLYTNLWGDGDQPPV